MIKPDIAGLGQTLRDWASLDMALDQMFRNQPLAMGPRHDQQRSIVLRNRVEMDPHGPHGGDNGKWRLHVQDALLAGPWSEIRMVHPVLYCDRPVLMPAQRPIVAITLVKIDRADWFQRQAAELCDQAANWAVRTKQRLQSHISDNAQARAVLRIPLHCSAQLRKLCSGSAGKVESTVGIEGFALLGVQQTAYRIYFDRSVSLASPASRWLT